MKNILKFIKTHKILPSIIGIFIILLLFKSPTYLLELYKNFSWPLVFLVMCLLFKNSIIELITHFKNVKSLKAKDLEFEFFEQVKNQMEQIEKISSSKKITNHYFYRNETASTEVIAMYKYAFQFAANQRIYGQNNFVQSAFELDDLLEQLIAIKFEKMPKYTTGKLKFRIRESLVLFINLYDTIPKELADNVTSTVDLIEKGLFLSVGTQEKSELDINILVRRTINSLHDFFVPLEDR